MLSKRSNSCFSQHLSIIFLAETLTEEETLEETLTKALPVCVLFDPGITFIEISHKCILKNYFIMMFENKLKCPTIGIN